MYSNELKKEILFIVRRTLNLCVRHQHSLLDYKPVNPFLEGVYNVAIALFKNGRLRGRVRCNGFDSLYKVLIYSVVGVSFFDSRFNPVSIDELLDIVIEVSIYDGENGCVFKVSEFD